MSHIPYLKTVMEPETPRLRLRSWNQPDYDSFARMSADPRVMEYFPAPLSREESDAFALRCAALLQERGWGLWAVEIKNGCPFIGFVGLHTPSAPLPFSPCVEVGWRLATPHWGQGYATEAAQAALHVGFDTLRLEEIVAFTTQSNQRSQAVMQRLGMRRDIPFEHPALPPEHPLRPHILYRLSRTAYEEMRKELKQKI